MLRLGATDLKRLDAVPLILGCIEQFDGVRWSVPAATLDALPAFLPAGRVATAGGARPPSALSAFSWQGPSWHYNLIVEPTQRHWLFALDYSQPQDSDVLLTGNGTLYALRPLQQKRQISLQYYPQATTRGELSRWQRQQDLALALELLDQIDLEVGSAGHFEDLEQGYQGHMMFEGARRADEVGDFLEQVFEAEKRADPLVERIFVGDHARA